MEINQQGMRRHYQTLGLAPGANPSQIEDAYRRLVMAFHPDRDPELGSGPYIKIQSAYEALMGGTAPEPQLRANLPGQGERRQRRGTPGQRRFECIMEDQYKGVHLRTRA